MKLNQKKMAVSTYKTTNFKVGEEVTYVKEHAIKIINASFLQKENVTFQDLINSVDIEDRYSMMDMVERIKHLITNYDLLKDYFQKGIVTSTNERGVFVKYYSNHIEAYESTPNLTNPSDLIHGHLDVINDMFSA